MSEFADQTCRRNCWLVSAVGAVVIAALLRFMALFSLGAAVFFGLMFLGLFGGFLIWAFCTGKGTDAAPRLAPMPEAAPAPTVLREVAAVTPRPDPSVVPAPVKPTAPVAAPMVSTVAQVQAVAPEPPKAKAKAAPKAATVKTAPKTAAPKAVAVKADAPKPVVKSAKLTPAVKPTKTPRASGLDAAMGRTKEAEVSKAPVLLEKPRGGKGDDLKQIKGVGPALEKLLNQIGVWHFDQIASWKARDIAHVDAMMKGFKGRITRDEWVKQARVLARGGATEFSARVAKGDVY